MVISAENFARKGNLSPLRIPTMSNDMDQKLKLAHKLVDVVDRANRKVGVNLFWNIMDKPESSYDQVRLFAGNTEDHKLQQIAYVNSKFEEFIYLLDVMNSVYYKNYQ